MEDIMKDIESIISKKENIKGEICDVLGMDEQEYCAMQYNEGIRYLDSYVLHSERIKDTLTRSGIFWKWWKNHWEMRDITFLETLHFIDGSQGKINRIYRRYHDGEELVSEMHPGATILEESYSELINNLFNKDAIL